jgi:hypothetical protein
MSRPGISGGVDMPPNTSAEESDSATDLHALAAELDVGEVTLEQRDTTATRFDDTTDAKGNSVPVSKAVAEVARADALASAIEDEPDADARPPD